MTFPLSFFCSGTENGGVYHSKHRKGLFRKGIRIIGRFRAVQVFLQAVDYKFMIRDMVKIGGNDSPDHRGTSLDADGGNRLRTGRNQLPQCPCTAGVSPSRSKTSADIRELRSISFTVLNFLSIHF